MMRMFELRSKLSVVFVVITFATGSSVADENLVKGELRLNYLGQVGDNGKRYFVGDDVTTWQGARYECDNFQMSMATINSTAEQEFLRPLLELSGPWWFGARDIGQREMFVWSQSVSAPNPSSEPLPEYVNFYNSIEEGPMGIAMHPAFGTYFVGIHSHREAAKALCQL